MSNEIELMREIAKLQGQIDALRTIEVGGVWKNWTPTVTYAGGTTDPTSVTTACVYNVIGGMTTITVNLGVTRGSGDRTSTTITLPKNYSGTYGFAGAAFNTVSATRVVYFLGSGGNRIIITHGAMTSDGVIRFTASYVHA